MKDLSIHIGDQSENGMITIVDEDRLCYLVRSESKGAVGIRTISKALLKEFVELYERRKDISANEARDLLCGKSDIDKFEYGYAATLVQMAKMSNGKVVTTRINNSNYVSISSRQIIFYGAPGTGKSHKIKERLESENVPKENIFRTTFHPDSDYSTFVGAYKPTRGKKPLYGLNGSNTVRLHNNGEDLTEEVITYKFVPQAFLKAYIRAYEKPTENVYLIIEEINRGNCAQIFGDLFQLLDRDENGKSDYTIKADDDLKDYLEDEFKRLGVSNDGIADGELCLPSNLFIYATMNTSDPSLFPIDSAFKRRWDWEYEPIKYNHDLKIKIGNEAYTWTSFQKIVNGKIKDATNSEDKMLGDYFVNPSNGVIDENTLRNKIMFYLWNDVCKDGEGDIFKISETENISFSELYGDKGRFMLNQMMNYLKVEKYADSSEDEEDEEEEEEDDDDFDTLSTGDNTKRNNAKFSINGELFDENGKRFGKGTVVKRAVEIFCNNNPELTAIEIRDQWISQGFKIPHIVETEEDKERRLTGSQDKTGNIRAKAITTSKGEVLYVSTQVGSDKVYNNFEDFLERLSKTNWNIQICEV